MLILTECDVCPLPENQCLLEGSTCYLIFCRNVNDWFHAKQICQSEGADLAILKTNNINQMADYLYKLPNTCSYYWIGITKFSWTRHSGKYIKQL